MDSGFEQFRHEFCGHRNVLLKKKGVENVRLNKPKQALVSIFLNQTGPDTARVRHTKKEAAGKLSGDLVFDSLW
jgi:hypothetical protein